MNTLTSPSHRLLRTFSLAAGSFVLTAATQSMPELVPQAPAPVEDVAEPALPLMANRTAKESLFCFVQLGFYSGTTVRDALEAPDTPTKRAMAAHFNNYNAKVTTPKESREMAKAVSKEYDAIPLANRRATADACMDYL